MKILVTGAKGFIGKNLICKLEELNKHEIMVIDIDNSSEEFEKSVLKAEFIFHLVGVNRPENDDELKKGNAGLTEKIVNILKAENKKTPILITSSIQAELNNPYGVSKKLAEEVLLNYKKEAGADVCIYRLPNVFGKWCRPNYNSVIATFCNNIANGDEVWVSDKEKEMTLVYIDDVVSSFINSMESKGKKQIYNKIEVEYKATLGKIIDLINNFKESRKTLQIADMND